VLGVHGCRSRYQPLLCRWLQGRFL
jgi:hypothetical protein